MKPHFLIFASFQSTFTLAVWNTIDDRYSSTVFYIETKPHFFYLALYYGPIIIFYFTANTSSLLIIFKYARVETTCYFLTLFIEIGVFRVWDRDFPFGIGSSVRYLTILARSELPRPIKILICRIAREFRMILTLFTKNRVTWRPSLSKEKSAKSWNFR